MRAKQIRAKYPSRCVLCERPIKIGDVITWAPRKLAVHGSCRPAHEVVPAKYELTESETAYLFSLPREARVSYLNTLNLQKPPNNDDWKSSSGRTTRPTGTVTRAPFDLDYLSTKYYGIAP